MSRGFEGRPAGELSQEAYDKAVDWITTQWGTSDCPFHGPTDWYVGRVLAEARSYGPVAGFSNKSVYPFIVVTCTKCGYSVLVNAIVAGVVPSTQPAPLTASDIRELADRASRATPS